ncbi:peptide/nickel transport system permease protein [Actinopolymorpha cephalotaxi]|uniref:Peptide/nickel transport system permease protein n=1 Tax=Actinopolymorpha cephalotaxi TaxID=504797 RepID=A0A1I2MYH6_9ACTN|nr:ABC transporter permease [Actinopolymorpha cephalotaxi]NYH85855.1 peptide/nickel transport system permease protein [Actinopolymorpha cephalotaxi]SFF94527.1 peptide/nickel transport system permease protein [Actinopolymorpha cephalotaxi]
MSSEVAVEPGRVRSWLAAHPLASYAVRRFGLYLVELWGAVTVAFFFFRLIPGDPIQTFIQTLQQNYVYNAQASAAVIDRYRAEFGLDGNLFSQYLHYMYRVLFQQSLGPSLINYPTPAQDVIMRALPWTVGLLGLSAVLAWVIGLLVGALAGWRRGKAGADLVTNVAIALSHVPYYFLALILTFVFAYQLAWLPARSAYNARLTPGISPEFIFSLLKYGLLPSLSIVVIGVFSWLLSTRMLMVPVLGEDYLTYAQAKGLRPRKILTKYALRNCYLPQVTAFGISLGFIFNGNVLVEQLFNYPGLGATLVNAIQILDFNTILGVTNLAIFAVLTANLILDLLLPLLDPRVKYWR